VAIGRNHRNRSTITGASRAATRRSFPASEGAVGAQRAAEPQRGKSIMRSSLMGRMSSTLASPPMR
jgi:hypothetical protein